MSSGHPRLVVVERLRGGVAKLTLNNPPLNLVTLKMTAQLMRALEEFERDAGAVSYTHLTLPTNREV